MKKKKSTLAHFTVYYAWVDPEGKEQRGHTIVSAVSKDEGYIAFQKANPHVIVVESGTVSNDPAFVTNMAYIFEERSISNRASRARETLKGVAA
jgi:hypothetical protein